MAGMAGKSPILMPKFPSLKSSLKTSLKTSLKSSLIYCEKEAFPVLRSLQRRCWFSISWRKIVPEKTSFKTSLMKDDFKEDFKGENFGMRIGPMAHGCWAVAPFRVHCCLLRASSALVRGKCTQCCCTRTISLKLEKSIRVWMERRSTTAAAGLPTLIKSQADAAPSPRQLSQLSQFSSFAQPWLFLLVSFVDHSKQSVKMPYFGR